MSEPVLRPVRAEDFDGIIECLRRNGMYLWTRSEWDGLHSAHPYASEFADVPRGLVLEADGVIVGSATNLWAKYWFTGRTLRAVVTGNTAVDSAYRGASFKLLGEQVRLRGADLYLNGSPSAVASKIMDTLKVRRVPLADYDVSYLWVLNGRNVALAALRRRGVPLAGVLSPVVGLGLRALSGFRSWRLKRGSFEVRQATAFGPEFDDFWVRLRDGSRRLLAFRDRAMLIHRYGGALAAGRGVLLTIARNGELYGYAMLLYKERPQLGVTQFIVHDLQVAEDNESAVAALLSAALEVAAKKPVDLLEWVGRSEFMRAIARQASGVRFRLPVWQAFYSTRDPDLKKALELPENWDFGPFDSD